MPDDGRPIIAHVVNSLARGGMERALVRLLHAPALQRFRHLVVTIREAGPLAEELPDHTACRALRVRSSSRSAWRKLARILRAGHVSVIHARGAGCWVDALLAGWLTPVSRLILGFHGWEIPSPVTWPRVLAARLARRGGARFLTVSESARKRLAERMGFSSSAIMVIPNGVDMERFHPCAEPARQALREGLGYSSKHRVVGIVGSLTPVKRHDVLLRAFAAAVRENHELRLLIVGDGPLRSALEQRACDLGIASYVRFNEWQPEVVPFLGAMDIYVCCSGSEGQSNAMLEAMACGVPAITTPVGDHARWVSADCGIVLPDFESDSLRRAIEQLAGDEERRIHFGRSARARGSEFDLNQMAASYAQFYQSLLERDANQTATPSVSPGRPVLVP